MRVLDVQKMKHTHTISSLCLSISWERELAEYYETEKKSQRHLKRKEKNKQTQNFSL